MNFTDNLLSKTESQSVQGGFMPQKSGNYVNGILLPPSIDPNDSEAVRRFLAWQGSGPGGQGINP